MRKKGVTLTELIVVVGIIALLAAISQPAISILEKSLGVENNPVHLISSLLGSARAIAVKEQRYAGIHFERTDSEKQYCIMIIAEPAIPYPPLDIDSEQKYIPFTAIDGYQPVSLGKKNTITSVIDANDLNVDIIYSPSGRLVRKFVMLCSNPAKMELETGKSYYEQLDKSHDDIFNINNKGLFKIRLGKMSEGAISLCNELKVDVFYINTYTGKLIKVEGK